MNSRQEDLETIEDLKEVAFLSEDEATLLRRIEKKAIQTSGLGLVELDYIFLEIRDLVTFTTDTERIMIQITQAGREQLFNYDLIACAAHKRG